MAYEPSYLDALVVLGGLWLAKKLLVDKPSAPLPPGPKRKTMIYALSIRLQHSWYDHVGWPIVGNLFQMPKERVYLQHAQWAKEFDSAYFTRCCVGIPADILSTSRRYRVL